LCLTKQWRRKQRNDKKGAAHVMVLCMAVEGELAAW
jgi:hypothetical protein